MKQQQRKYNNPITALILGLAKNEHPPILRRDLDGDIVRRFSDEEMNQSGLRTKKLELDRIFSINRDKQACKRSKSIHKRYGQLLNSDRDKEMLIQQMERSMNHIYLRMNARLIVVGYSK